jgi:hypothetical protein
MPPRENTTLLRTLGSLWFASALLVLIAVAMAAATIFETHEGTERAFSVFYGSWWFGCLLAILAINLFAAFIVRGPYGRKQLGFIATHAAVLLIFIGALATKFVGVGGQLIVTEGETRDAFRQSDHPTLAVADSAGSDVAEMRLSPSKFMGDDELADLNEPVMTVGDVTVHCIRYLPDAEQSRRVVDGRPDGKTAIDVAFLADNHDLKATIIAGETMTAGPIPLAFRQAASNDELQTWISTSQPADTDSKGTVKIEHEGKTYSFPVEQCMNQAVAIGETGYSIRVTRYLPHAVVSQEKTVVSASSQPVNPYIEAELTGPAGTELRRAFAKFPEFDSMHSGKTPRAVRLSLEASTIRASSAPVEVLAAPDGRMFVRFSGMGGVDRTTEFAVGTPVDTPFQGWKFLVRQKHEGAKWEESVAPVSPVRRQGRQQAIQLSFNQGGVESTVWAVYGRPTTLAFAGRSFDVRFDDAMIPLGFQLKLDAFRIVAYPGTRRPRSYESRVTIQDPQAGGELSRVISMNHPLEYGGYTFYQSSYVQDEMGNLSVLSVSRDPGRPITFAGYVLLLVGMVWVLVKRMAESRRASQSLAAGTRQAAFPLGDSL